MKLSVITATLNSEETISDTIDSLNSQTYSDVEHIIVDGFSKDKTIEIINKKKRFETIIISEKDEGIYPAINKGIQVSSGDIIFLLHSDDILYDGNVINDIINVFNQSDADVVYGNILFFDKIRVDKITRVWVSGNYSKAKIYFGWHPPHTSLFVRRKIFDKYGFYNTNLKIASDYEFMIRIFLKNDIKVRYINRFIIKMREGGKSTASLFNHIYSNYECQKGWIINTGFINPLIFFKPIYKIPQLFLRKPTTS